MINPGQFLDLVVGPTLAHLEMDGDAARALLMGTAMQESALSWLAQVRGPALGIFQMEPATFFDIRHSWLPARPAVRAKVQDLSTGTKPEEMVWNLRLAAAMCRLQYRRHAEPLPAADDVRGLAAYWKRYYNTPRGAGTVEQFLASYERVRSVVEADRRKRNY